MRQQGRNRIGAGRRVVALLLTWLVPADAGLAVTAARAGTAVPAAAASTRPAAHVALDEPGSATSGPQAASRPAGAAALMPRDVRVDGSARGAVPADVDEPAADDGAWEAADSAAGDKSVGGPAPDGSFPPVSPILECVVAHADGSYTAYFGYKNDGNAAVTIPVGSGNMFTPSPHERGQPATFQPGRTPPWPDAAFSVTFNGTHVKWKVKGPGGQERFATASAASARCQGATDTTPPQIRIAEPLDGSYLATNTPTLRVTYSDNGVLNLASFRVLIDNVDRTAWFSVGPSEASAVLDASTALTEGARHVTASIADSAGNSNGGTADFTVDTLPPQVFIVAPFDNTYVSAHAVDVSGGVIDASPVSVRVDTTDAVVEGQSFSAVGVPVGAGPRVTLVARATDAAGNTGAASVTLHVDRTPPVVQIQAPQDGDVLAGPSVQVTGTVSDDSPGVSVDVNGTAAAVEAGTFSATLTAVDGALTITATARDAANLTASHALDVSVDSVPPVLVVDTPLPGTLTRGTAVTVAGHVTDASSVVLEVAGAVTPVGADGSFTTQVALPDEGTRTIGVKARDAAQLETTETVSVIVDRTPPVLHVASPLEDALLAAQPVLVQGTVSDAREVTVTVDGVPAELTGDAWQAERDGLAEEPHTFVVVAADAAGNRTTVTRPVDLDFSAPSVVISEPDDGLLTREANVTVRGTVDEAHLATLVVKGVVATVEGAGPGPRPFVATGVPLDEGENRLVAQATDTLARAGHAGVDVTRDSTPPSVTLNTPDKLTFANPGVAEASASDSRGVATVEFHVNGEPAGTFTEPPYSIPLAVPPGVGVGGTFSVTVEARDAAGNVAETSRHVTVVAEGVVVGQVLADESGLPLPGATVRLLSGAGGVTTSDARGRYSFPVTDAQATLAAEKDGTTSVERTVAIEAGVGVVPVDARLTSLGSETALDAAGGTLQAEFTRRLRPADPGVPAGASPAVLTVTVPPGALAGPAALRLTPLTAQGLPGLLPLGWSAVLAFDLRASAAPAALSAHAVPVPDLPLHLVRYDTLLHAWTLVTAHLVPSPPSLSFALPGAGAFALVTPDVGAPALPEPGGVLTGAPFTPIPDAATSTSLVDPPTLPPTGGRARGRLVVESPQALPSGTVVQAQVTETFSLADGSTVSEETRVEDILLSRADVDGLEAAAGGAPALAAELPVQPVRGFQPAELVEGRVHLDILAGRENIRGASGGSTPVSVSSGGATLVVPGGALPGNTAIALDVVPLSPFVPQPAGFTALGEIVVDLSGATLGLPAELSLNAAGVPADGAFFLARVERVAGVAHLQAVAWAEHTGARVATRAHADLRGLREGGRYIFYRAQPAVGLVAGSTRAAGQAVRAVVSTDGLPFVGLADDAGSYVVAALAGSATVEARVPGTPLVGGDTALVSAGETTPLHLELEGALTSATVTPADGAVDVALSVQVEIEASAALDPASLTPDNLRLRQAADNSAVPLRFLLAGDGRRVAVIPEQALAFGTTYTFTASGVFDAFGGPVAVPVSTFTTRLDVPPVVDLDALVFSYPENGVSTMSAPAGALPAGSWIVVLNATNGFILTKEVGDVPISETLPASIHDRLLVTVTDPSGHTHTVERTQFVAPDGTTAVGTNGGRVVGEGGVELRLPPGAVDRAVTLRIESFDEASLPAGERPDLPGANFGAGLKIDSPDLPVFKKEIDLVFPKPADAPAGAFYYVFRKMQLGDGGVAFETIDQAFVEGDKVVTASPPFSGYYTSLGFYNPASGGLSAVQISYAYLMWTHDSINPGRASSGIVTGQVLRTVYDPGSSVPRYVPVEGAVVSGDREGQPLVAHYYPGTHPGTTVSQKDGTFTLVDPRYLGGNVTVWAISPQGERKAGTAYESDPLDPQNYNLRFFRNIARVTITLEPLDPPPVPPTVRVAVVRLGPLVGERTRVEGLVSEGARLLVGIDAANAEVLEVSIGGQARNFGADQGGSQSLSFRYVTLEEFIASPAGLHHVEVKARSADQVERTYATTFRVVGQGGGNGEPLPGRPEVLDGRSVPSHDARELPVSTRPHVEFTEPVRGLPGSVQIFEIGAEGAQTAVDVRLIGVPPGEPVPVAVNDASQEVVALQVQPQPGLKFSRRYRLALGGEITDRDGEALVPYTLEFETFNPTGSSTQVQFASPGLVVFDERAYLVENQFLRGIFKSFDVSNPLVPEEVPLALDPATTPNRPVDLTGHVRGDGREELVLSIGPTNKSLPSSVLVYELVRPEEPKWVAAASVSNGAVDGYIVRTVVRDRYAYALTQRKGVRVVDLDAARSVFPEFNVVTKPAAFWEMLLKLNTEGQGFGMSAVTAAWPLPVSAQFHWTLRDIDVGSFNVDGQTKPVAFVAGSESRAGTCRLAVGAPHEGRTLVEYRVLWEGVELCPERLKLARTAGRELALVAGTGAFGENGASATALAVVDVIDPKQPQVIGFTVLDLPEITDVLFADGRVLVASARGVGPGWPRGGTQVIDLSDPEHPFVAGRVEGLSGRLAGGSGVYFSTGGTATGTTQAGEGGLHTAQLDPRCNLLDLRTEKVLLDVVVDPVNNERCGAPGAIVFTVCRPALVTLTIDGRVPTLPIEGLPPLAGPGGEPQLLSDLPLEAGLYVVNVPYGTIGESLNAKKPFVLKARSQSQPTENPAILGGTIANNVTNRSVLPVGRTLVQGVDLFDGHLVQQSVDVRIEGRHMGLDVTRTYSSAAESPDDVLGAGWSWNYASSARRMDGCNRVVVTTATGSSQVFRTDDSFQTFTPQKGYHTELRRDGDEGLIFTDKSGLEHYFRDPLDPTRPGAAYRLDKIVEPHGDRIQMQYDLKGRVSEVAEVLRGERAVRRLRVRYAKKGHFDRVARVESNLGHLVEYEYDEHGNLIDVKRHGRNVGGQPEAEASTDHYEYSIDSLRDRHQMAVAVGSYRERVEYTYYTRDDVFPGEENLGFYVADKEEFVKSVRAIAGVGPVPEPTTLFAYDYRDANAGLFRATVTDARGNDTRYTMNSNGSATLIDEPAPEGSSVRKVTEAVWAADDIFKTQETDANGRVTRFEHTDGRGNLTAEQIEKDGVVLARKEYEYAPRFNKRTRETDPEGRTKRATIDPASGDVLDEIDAAGNVTRHAYDADGRLTATTDPRGALTRFDDFNDYGKPRRTVFVPYNHVTTVEYDARNRPTRAVQAPFNRVTLITYDGFDRPLRSVKRSGQPAGDGIEEVEYYPNGEKKSETNSLGGRTEYPRDGLNRVVGTSVQVGGETFTTVTEYDGNGNILREKDRRGVWRRFEYDALNRLMRVYIDAGLPGMAPVGLIAEFGYDPVGNKLFDKDVAGLRTDFEHDGLYRKTVKWLPESMPAGHAPAGRLREQTSYDKVGNVLTRTDPNGRVTRFEYDALNRVERTTRDFGGLNLVSTSTYCNDPAPTPPRGGILKCEDHDQVRGLRTRYEYDLLGRETERRVRLEGPGADPASGLEYVTTTTYEDDGHALLVQGPRPGTATRVRLDGLDREIERIVDPFDADGDGQSPTTKTEHDGAGNKTKVLDPRDQPTSFVYDELGRLVTTTDVYNKTIVTTYDGEGLKQTEKDRRNVVRQFAYDNLGRLRKAALATTHLSGVAWSQETRYLDTNPPRRIEIDALETPTEVQLDGLYRVVRETDVHGHSVATTWDGVNRRAVRDKRGHVTTHHYDGIDRLVKTTDPEPFADQTVETTYDDAQNRVSEKDRRGTHTAKQLDPLGRTVTVTRDGVLIEKNVYDPAGNKVLGEDGHGRKTRFDFDKSHRLVARLDGFDSDVATTTLFTYDPNGNKLKEFDPRVSTAVPSMEYVYDALNRVVEQYDGRRQQSVYGYDEDGNRQSVKEPEAHLTTFTYDELGKLLTVTQPTVSAGEPVTSYKYDKNRNRLEQRDAKDQLVTMQYDDLNRLRYFIQEGGLTTEHQYDPNGNEERLIDPGGQTVVSVHDELNRPTLRSYALAQGAPDEAWRRTKSIEYGYDENGNPTSFKETSVAPGGGSPIVSETARVYDRLDRLTSETATTADGQTRTVSYSYYNNGLRKTVTDTQQNVTSYEYDGKNRLSQVRAHAGTPHETLTTYDYWPDDLLKTVTYPNGVQASYGYDDADRLTSLVNTQDAAVVSSYAYEYDKNGNRLVQTETNGGVTETTTYTYDALNRLETVTYPADVTYPHGRTLTYGYDLVGNRERETETDGQGVVLSDKTAVFDRLNRLESVSDPVQPANDAVFTWDNNGNLRTKTTGGVTTTYVYDTRDKLVETKAGGQSTARFRYDFEGRRTTKSGDDGFVQFIYDGTSVLEELDLSGNQAAKYEWGSDRLISLLRTNEPRRYYSFDGLGSVVSLTDDAGAVVASYHLDAWGNYRFPAELTASRNRFGFTGYYFDSETDLYYAKARYFDPQFGRFLTQDSYLGEIDNPPSLHRYFYGNANPTRYIDPTGHAALEKDEKEDKPQTLFGGRQATIGPREGGSVGRGAVYYTLETAAEFVSPIPLGLSDPDTSIHPLASDNQATEDYEAFKAKYGRGAQAVEGAAVMKYGGKVGKVVGGVMILGAVAFGGKPGEVNGTQGEQNSFGPDRGDRDPLPAQKEAAQRTATADRGPYRGGAHAETKGPRGDQLESHHMPAKAASPLDPEKGPAIQMEPADHRRTSSYGGATAAVEYRAEVKELIDQGKWREAIAMEIRDVRRVAGAKYTAAIQEMLKHAESLGLLRKK